MPDAPDILPKLTLENALAFRLTHWANIPFILKHGLHSRSSGMLDPNFVQIGLPHLIERRRHRAVPIPPGGVLADYIPFYFTPRTPMALNIITGRDVTRHDRAELVFLVVSARSMLALDCAVFADRHAVLETARFSSYPRDLSLVDWRLLRTSNYKRRPDNPLAFERYEAELLLHRHLPTSGLMGLACANSTTCETLKNLVQESGVPLPVAIRPEFFFA